MSSTQTLVRTFLPPRVFACLAVVFTAQARADFTLVSEATVDGQRQLTTVSLREKRLRVSVRIGGNEVVFIRDTSAGRTLVLESGRPPRIISDLPEAAATQPGVGGYTFEPQREKHRRAGQSCESFIARHELPLLTFSSCYAPWSALGLGSSSEFAQLFPNAATIALFPNLVMFTLTWTGLHPGFASALPGVPLERTGFFVKGPTTRIATKVIKLENKSLDAALFEMH